MSEHGRKGTKLLELGATVNSTTTRGETALFFAEPDVASVLVDHKIDLDVVNHEVCLVFVWLCVCVSVWCGMTVMVYVRVVACTRDTLLYLRL